MVNIVQTLVTLDAKPVKKPLGAYVKKDLLEKTVTTAYKDDIRQVVIKNALVGVSKAVTPSMGHATHVSLESSVCFVILIVQINA